MKVPISPRSTEDRSFAVGDRIFLRGCRVGEPGRVLRIERSKVVILWTDLDYIGRHSPAALMIAGEHEPRKEQRDVQEEP
jgi:hypothetical protein